MNKEQIARLKELTEKATPGPWVYFGYESGNGNISLTVGTEKPGRDICKAYSQLGHHNCSCNAAFIAAANPQVILELIAENERLEKQVNWLAMNCQRVRKFPTMNGRPEDDWTAHKWREAAREAVAGK